MSLPVSVKNYTIPVRSTKRVELINLTSKVSEKLRESGLKQGVVIVYSRHTTSALIINEDEERLKADVLSMLERLIPKGAGYRHDEIDDNADAHLRQTMLQPFLIVPFSNGSMQLGTWQSLFFLELDGPRSREILVSIIGE